MNKLLHTLFFSAIVGLISGCNGSSSNSSTNTNNWNLVGGSIPGSNIILNSIAYSSGQIYTGGSLDVNNPAVFNFENSWQITGGNYLPNPYGVTEQVNSIAIDTNKTLYVAVNATTPGSFGDRPTEIEPCEFASGSAHLDDFVPSAGNFAQQNPRGDDGSDQINDQLNHVRPNHCRHSAQICVHDRCKSHYQHRNDHDGELWFQRREPTVSRVFHSWHRQQQRRQHQSGGKQSESVCKAACSQK